MTRKAFYLDLAERTVWTAVQTLAAALLVLDEPTWPLVGAAALAAACKAIVAARLPWTADGSASTLPADAPR